MTTDSKLTKSYDLISYHITGCYPIRALSLEDRKEYNRVHLCYYQMGFEPLIVAVYSDHGVTCGDAADAADEYLAKRKSDETGETLECDRVELAHDKTIGLI